MDHFGEAFEIVKKSKKTIIEYFKTNSAKNYQTESAVKILKSLGGSTPMRMAEIINLIKAENGDRLGYI